MPPEAQTPDTPLTDEQLSAAFPGQDLDHIKSMMGKMDGGEPAAAATEEQGTTDEVVYPDYIPEKFRSGTLDEAHAKLAESYKNLESKLGGKPPASDPEAGSEASQEAAEEQPELTLKDVGDEYLKNGGTISEATYKHFEDKGLSREVLDGYISGQQAIANQLVTKAYSEAGGEQQYADMVKWAGDNWSEAEVEAFDSIVSGSNEAAVMVAIRGLKASYQAAEGIDPTLVQGDTGSLSVKGGYQSRAEMTADMKKPEYKKDPAFRKMVEQKIANSSIW